MFIIKLLLMFFVLGIIILIHEFGHFMWAKKFKVHIFEFSIGMGPIIHTHKGKDNIDYNIRAVPIGGFVSMAGEVYDDDETGKIPKESLLCNKPWHQRLIIMIAGVVNNFILAIVLLIIFGSIWGGGAISPKVKNVQVNGAAAKAGIKAGDTILKINDYKVKNWDKAQIIIYYKNPHKYYTFKVKHADGKVENIKVTPNLVRNPNTGEEQKVFGIEMDTYKITNPINAIGYGFAKCGAVLSSMVYTITGLFTGKISLNSLSGPVGIYTIVGAGISKSILETIRYTIYIIAYLSINVGFINILPFPAFDGGHVLFLLIEKIKGSPVNSKIENTLHLIGFALIFLLMIIISISDIIKLF